MEEWHWPVFSVDVLHAWLNWRRLEDPPACCSNTCGSITWGSLGKTPLCAGERMRAKWADNVSVLPWNDWDPRACLKEPQVSSRVPRPHLENHRPVRSFWNKIQTPPKTFFNLWIKTMPKMRLGMSPPSHEQKLGSANVKCVWACETEGAPHPC